MKDNSTSQIMHPTDGIPIFEGKVKEDWEGIMDLAVHLSETIGKHIEKPEIISGLITSSDESKKGEFLKQERKELRNSLEDDHDANIGEKVKSVLMSVWKKIISRSNTLTGLQNIGRRIYERLIEKLLPFNFAEEDTPIWSGEEKEKSIENKLMEHFEDKIKESMRNRIQARMEEQIS